MTSFNQRFKELFMASYQLFQVRTYEPMRFEQTLSVAADALNIPVFSWNCVSAFRACTHDSQFLPKIEEALPPLKALEMVQQGVGLSPEQLMNQGDAASAVYIFYNFHGALQSPAIRMQLELQSRERRLCNAHYRRPIFFVHPPTSPRFHVELEHFITPFDFKMPSEQEIDEMIGRQIEELAELERNQSNTTCSPELREKIGASCCGLAHHQIDDVLALSLVRHRGFVPEIVNTIKEHKADLIGQSGMLEYVPEHKIPQRDELAGMEELMDFVELQAQAYTADARKQKLDHPKGICLIGVPGSGKSEVAKAISRIFQDTTGRPFPPYWVRVGAVFGGLVGQSESNMQELTDRIDAQFGCIAVFDEMEKMFNVGGGGDSGVGDRVFGHLLQWMSNKGSSRDDDSSSAYVVCTFNRTDGIPPEFFRRFDAVFYTTLPDPETSREILQIHMRKRGIDPTQWNATEWRELLGKVQNFLGSELEDVVSQARLRAYKVRGESIPTMPELILAAEDRKKSILMEFEPEAVNKIIHWCDKRARPCARSKAMSSTRPTRPGSRGTTLSR